MDMVIISYSNKKVLMNLGNRSNMEGGKEIKLSTMCLCLIDIHVQ